MTILNDSDEILAISPTKEIENVKKIAGNQKAIVHVDKQLKIKRWRSKVITWTCEDTETGQS